MYLIRGLYNFLSSLLVLIPQIPCSLPKGTNFFDLVTFCFYAETPEGTA